MQIPNVPNHPEFDPVVHHVMFNLLLVLSPESSRLSHLRRWHLVDDGTIYVGFRSGFRLIKFVVPFSPLNLPTLKSFDGFGMDAARRATAKSWWHLRGFEEESPDLQEEIRIDGLGRFFLAGYRAAFMAMKADLDLWATWAV